MSESYLDRPQDDNTPKAHPAFKRGKITGVVAILAVIRNVIIGADTGAGENVSPQVESVRRAVLELVQALEADTSKDSAKALTKAKSLVASIKM
tara:strand:+ start:1595 stop:1876 length:282 start_codon:yes stop_codon:yes gene_type:complete